MDEISICKYHNYINFKVKNMKKISSILVLLAGVAILTGCSFGGDDKPVMDQASSDGNYHYRNKSLDFQVEFPSTFEYYQTQRKEGEAYTDIEFMVPTKDEEIGSKGVFGYARPLVVRVFEDTAWENVDKEGSFEKVGERNGKVYTIQFWEHIPTDWQERWGEEVEENILENFQLKDI